MPGLPRQHVDLIPRLDQAVDPRTAPVGFSVVAQNCFRVKTGEFRRRAGNSALGVTSIPASSGSLPEVWQLGTHKGALVALAKTNNGTTGQMPWVWSETAQKWSAPGTAEGYAVRTELQSIITSTRRSVYAGDLRDSLGHQTTPGATDMAVIPSTRYAVVVWSNQDSSPTTFTEVIQDLDTGQLLSRNKITGDHVHVETTGTAVTVVYYDGSANLKCRDWTSTSAATGTPTRTASFAATMPAALADRRIDTTITTTANIVAIAYVQTKDTDPSTAAGLVSLILYDNSAGTSPASTAIVVDSNKTLGLMRDLGSSGQVRLVTVGKTDGVKLWVRNGSTLAAVSNAVLSSNADTAKANVHNVTGYTIPGGIAGDFTCLWDVDSNGVSGSPGYASGTAYTVPYDSQIMYCSQLAGSIGSAGVYLRSVSLRSKAFTVSSDVFVLVNYDSVYQPTYFLMHVGGFPDGTQRAPVLKLNRLRGNGHTEIDAGLTNVTASSSTYLLAVPRAVEARSESAGVTTALGVTAQYKTVGVDVVTLTADTSSGGRPVEYADSLMVPIGQLCAFDGATFAELNFPIYPEPLTTRQDAGGSLAVSSDTGVPSQYMYTAVYRHTDASGRIHRSTPAVPAEVVLPADGSKRTVEIQVPNLRVFGQRETGTNLRNNITIEIYRTELNGTEFFLLTEFANDPTACLSATYTDPFGDDDAAIAECLPLYCQLLAAGAAAASPGPLEHQTPPQLSCIVNHRGRLFGISADDPQEIWYSQPVAAGLGPIFNEVLTLRIDDDLGDCTALASMDDKLVVFKRGAVYVVMGDGPDNNGNGTYAEPHRIALGLGASSPRSVAVTPDGAWFQSPKGLSLVDRGLNVSSVPGARIQDALGSATIVDVVHVDNANQVRFYLSNGTCLVWDYQQREFYYWTGQGTRSAVKWGTRVAQVVGNLSGGVWYSNDSVWSDAGTGYQFRVTVTWLALAGISGYQRIYEVLAVGEYRAQHYMKMDLSYDYVDTVTEQVVATGAAPWQYKHKPARQKCHSLKVSIYDSYSTGITDVVPTGDTFRLSGLGIVASVKAPGGKVASSQKPTTQPSGTGSVIIS